MKSKLLERMSILYVEDDEITQKNLGRFLKRRVRNLYLASNGKEGLEIYQDKHPDIIVTDIKMPVMDGLTMIRRIKEESPKAPVILTTAYSDVEYLMKAIDIGVEKFVKKPINNDQVLYFLEQISVFLQHEYEVLQRNSIIQTILDWHPCFVIWTSMNNLEYINSRLLDFMGYSSTDDFFERHRDISEIIRHKQPLQEDRDDREEWFHYIIRNPDMDHQVFIKNRTDDNEKEYIIRFHHFENTEMYIFGFLEPVEAQKKNGSSDGPGGFC